MSEQHLHINYSLADIERYLQGKMSSAEMYMMEKAALHDEFLADAIEGYSGATENQSQQHLQQIRENLLGNKSPAKVVPISNEKNNWLKIAASIIAVITVGIIGWLATKPSIQNTQLARAESTSAKQEPVNNSPIDSPAKDSITIAKIEGGITSKNAAAQSESTVAANQLAAKDYNDKFYKTNTDSTNVKLLAQVKPEAFAFNANAKTSSPTKAEKEKVELKSMHSNAVNDQYFKAVPGNKVDDNSATKELLSKKINIHGQGNLSTTEQPLYIINGIQVDSTALSNLSPSDIKKIEVLTDNNATALYGAKAKNGAVIVSANNSNNLRGKITDQYGNGIANASVNISNTNKYFTADNAGNFVLPYFDTAAYVTANSLGYEPATIRINANNSNNIKLLPNLEALDEVVVIGYGTKKRKDVTGSISSINTMTKDTLMPVGGWSSFNNYINQKVNFLFDTTAQNTVVVTDRDGNVLDEIELEFSIDKKGVPYNVKVIGNIDAFRTRTIINLMKTGPKWISNKKINRTKILLKK